MAQNGRHARAAALLAVLCGTPLSAQQTPSAANRLTSAERATGWRLLFDGKTLTGWRGLGYDSVPTAHWKVVNGTIMNVANGNIPMMADGKPVPGGDLTTTGVFRDFELSFEWKIPPGSNSGVKYNVAEGMSSPSDKHAALGFEYQVLDDSLGEDNKIPSHRAGSLFDLIAPNATKKLAPVGQWNRSRIVLRGNHGEHWLNGTIILEYDLGTPYLDALIARSKYRSIPGFAERRDGHIVLQDHGEAAWYRSLKIRKIPP